MYVNYLLATLGGLALVSAQVPPPASTLTTTMSGVLPILPTPFSGVETEEGAIVYGGPAVVGFTGQSLCSNIDNYIDLLHLQVLAAMLQYNPPYLKRHTAQSFLLPTSTT